MKKILVVNASPRDEKSHSRRLAELFIETWNQHYPRDIFIHREVGKVSIPNVSERWIAAAFKKKTSRTEKDREVLMLSDELVQELKTADIYVIATPMYNWSIPGGLKSYIDQVMRINETWKFKSGKPDGHYVGLLKNKKLYILSSRGDSGYNEGEPNAHLNFQTTYLKTIFNIMGVENIEMISLDNEEYGGKKFARSQAAIFKQIRNINKITATRQADLSEPHFL